MYIPIDAEPSNLTWQHGRGLVPRGRGPMLSNFGVSLYLCLHLCHSTTKFDMV